MSCCGDTNKNNCWEKTASACVIYQKYLPEYSNLDQDCATIEETTEELYKNQESIKDSIDLTNLGTDCINFNEFKEGTDLKVNEAFAAIEDKICEIVDQISEDSEESELNLDFKCLTSPCNEQINSLKDLLQVLIDEICTLKGQ